MLRDARMSGLPVRINITACAVVCGCMANGKKVRQSGSDIYPFSNAQVLFKFDTKGAKRIASL